MPCYFWMSNPVLSVQDLERKMDTTTHFQNQIEVCSNPDYSASVTIYRGTIDLRIQQLGAFWGSVVLQRYDRVTENKSEKRVISWIPYRKEVKQIPVTFDKEIWRMGAPHTCVLNDGEKIKISKGYKNALVEIARARGLLITPTLIESVFGPIDEQLVKLHQHNFWKRLETQ
jgi:hypothetical protein